ncbi:hypothetical protein [Synergistes jonesii]|uniref:hypothetical protein n=1 Tax=Synergistes jonesii TaxID=2754 RepID=UPI00248E34C5|nr:hypothetical protein [Synergistes jonesii]
MFDDSNRISKRLKVYCYICVILVAVSTFMNWRLAYRYWAAEEKILDITNKYEDMLSTEDKISDRYMNLMLEAENTRLQEKIARLETIIAELRANK